MMPSSGVLIDYRVRPAKNIERKMFVEAMARLDHLRKVESYRYIGFGAFYFADFILVHRSLGISNLISIESDSNRIDRYKFNIPFEGVSLEEGFSSSVLPSLRWNDEPSIVWLDYDSTLNSDQLDDLGTLVKNLASPSFFMVTIKSKAAAYGSTPEERFERLRQSVSIPKLSTGEINNLTTSKFHRQLWDLLSSRVEDAVRIRNGTRPTGSKLKCRQLLYFRYSDNAEMISVGWLLYEEAQSHLVQSCGFEDLKYYRSSSEPFQILPPNLTPKEKRYLDQRMPGKAYPRWLSRKQISDYRSVYRYYPIFAEIDI